MRRYHITVTKKLRQCNYECPNFKHHDGMGYCEDWFSCSGISSKSGEEPKDPHDAPKTNGFPVWCPLQEI